MNEGNVTISLERFKALEEKEKRADLIDDFKVTSTLYKSLKKDCEDLKERLEEDKVKVEVTLYYEYNGSKYPRKEPRYEYIIKDTLIDSIVDEKLQEEIIDNREKEKIRVRMNLRRMGLFELLKWRKQ